MNFKNKWALGISIGTGLILFICVVIPFIREKYLYWRLGYVDIAPVLIQEGDLPPDFIEGEIIDIEPYYYKSARAQEQEILASDGSQIGSVSVYLFASSSEQSEMYSIYSQVESQEGIIPYKVNDIGDQHQTRTSIFGTGSCTTNVVFTRCTAVGVIEIYASCFDKQYSFDFIVKHARRLDESLKSIACQ